MNTAQSITNKSIFGEYKYDEDRVTAALLHIFRIGGPDLISFVFDDFDIDLDVEVNTQVKKKKSRPDGELKANYHLFIESKIEPWESSLDHNVEQFKNHQELLKDGFTKLLYITIEDTCPEEIKQTRHPQIYWMNWKTILKKLQDYKPSFNRDVIEFLVDQFDLLIDNVVVSKYDGTTDENRVAIVGGKYAEEIARQYGFYACQADRKFRPSKYLAFYFSKRISHVFEIQEGPIQVKSLKDVAEKMGGYQFLPGDDSPHTFMKLGREVTIAHEIEHNSSVPYVRKQRYTTIEKITSARSTDDL